MDAKTLLAEATAETLRADARELRDLATISNREWEPRCRRLAALAEAVAIADGTLVLRQTAESLEAADMKGATPEAHLYFCWEPPEQSLPAALSTLLPASGDADVER